MACCCRIWFGNCMKDIIKWQSISQFRETCPPFFHKLSKDSGIFRPVTKPNIYTSQHSFQKAESLARFKKMWMINKAKYFLGNKCRRYIAQLFLILYNVYF